MNYQTTFENKSLAEYWCYIWNKHYLDNEHLIQEMNYTDEDGNTITTYHVFWRER